MKTLTRWDPFRDLSNLRRDVDELFRSSFGEGRGFGHGFGHLMREMEDYPLMECYTKDDIFYVKSFVPSLDPKHMEVTVTGNRLTLKGESKEDKSIKEEDYTRREIRYGSFERSIELPEGIDIDKIHASVEDGMLIISAPVKGAIKAKKINIEIPKKGTKAA